MLQSLPLLLYSLFRCFVIIPSSRNTCHASSSLFVICCLTSSCPDRRDRTVDFGLKKNGIIITGLSEKLTYFDLCFDFPAAISKLSTNSVIVNSMSDQFSIASFNWPIFELR